MPKNINHMVYATKDSFELGYRANNFYLAYNNATLKVIYLKQKLIVQAKARF